MQLHHAGLGHILLVSGIGLAVVIVLVGGLTLLAARWVRRRLPRRGGYIR